MRCLEQVVSKMLPFWVIQSYTPIFGVYGGSIIHFAFVYTFMVRNRPIFMICVLIRIDQ